MNKNKEYDVVIVGAGIFGCTCARVLADNNYKVLLVDRLPYVGGACKDIHIKDINVHVHGPHIFHTRNEKVKDFIKQFATFNKYEHRVKAVKGNKAYTLPINLSTFEEVYGFKTIEEIDMFRLCVNTCLTANNAEEAALFSIGKKMYYELIKSYSEKQWDMLCTEIPVSIINRIPVRYNYDDCYFVKDEFQGVPLTDYSSMFDNMIDHPSIHLRLGRTMTLSIAHILGDNVIWSGSLDEAFGYCKGVLPYRSLMFDYRVVDNKDVPKYSDKYAVVNYTGADVPYTRITNNKLFNSAYNTKDYTVLTYEQPWQWQPVSGLWRYYPIPTEENIRLYNEYTGMAIDDGVYFGGRCGSYRYMNMDVTIQEAFDVCNQVIRDN